ncbi:MAG: hypothetical protein ACYTGP_04870, partial [Planctomycetota bacterium]
MNVNQRTGRAWPAVVTVILAVMTSTATADFTWTGGGGDDSFTNNGNWDIGAPVDPVGMALIFGDDGGNYQVTGIDLDYTDVRGIRFTGALDSYTLSGTGSLAIAHGFTIENDSAFTQTFNVTIKGSNNMGGPGALNIEASAGDFIFNNIDLSDPAGVEATFRGSRDTTVNGVISGAGGSIVKTGTGRLILNNANTFGGPTSLQMGTTIAGNDQAFGMGIVQITGDASL